ncbi:ATP-binding cassette domain-containing protein [Nesterenkonia sp. MY13]|uniref:ATP-binding cassette domain-containing protein n=1 Tax=Nesterenkonia sedimenti TaxID=1463632 RepID=A0A7X8YDH2_9MICC|nr:ATP-binding cassette domain-containing protein [Nesterenkonia sedimenti]NLS09371.1 ATP-binding cassette domain-containing protein [Nesterenkonia sedimenti]
MTSTGVEVSAAGFSYQHADRPAPAISGLDLHIAPGEKVLLAGASGAGKSTLLHALAGVLHDDDADSTGQLLIDGNPPAEARGRAGLMQQDPESQVVLSRIGDDVAFSCENMAVDPEEIPSRVQQALAAVGLDHLPLDHPSSQLSGGQKQRLALAGILAMQPGLLLLDEPTANLDPEGTLQVRDAVVDAVTTTGSSLVVVEHRLSTWVDHVDTLVVLEPGGGVRHRVPAADFHTDQHLRAELTAAGLWVDADTAPVAADLLPADTGENQLLTARGLAVHRQSPKKSWRRGHSVQPVLSGVDMSLRSGTAVGITGRNGAGKSTLLLTLGGLLQAHAGELTAGSELKGERGAQLPDSPYLWRSADLTSRIGTVFQEPEHQFVRSTVSEELRLSAVQARIPGTRDPLFTEDEVTARVEHLLRRLRLEHLAEANPFTLSGGEKRRLSVGTALAAGPQVLMLDEPTFGQDAHTFAELIGLLGDHLRSGGTVLAVTHDESFLAALNAQRFDLTPTPSAASVLENRVPIGTRPTNNDAKNRRDSGTPLLSAVRDTSWLGRRGPLAKLIALFFITLALIATIDPVSAAVVAVVCFLLLPIADIRLLVFLRRIWIFAVASLVAVWGAAIAAEESGRVLLDLGVTTVSTGSLEMGVSLGARAFAIVLPSVLIFSTTDPTDLADSLAQQLKLPARFVLGALAAMRLLGLMAEHWTTLGHARRARGLGSRFFSQAFGLLVQAIRIATRLAVTMESRGFGAGKRSWARPARFTGADGLVVLGGLLIAAGATALAMTLGTWNLVWQS